MGFIGNQAVGVVATNLNDFGGTVMDSTALDSVTGMSSGTMYVTSDTNHGWIYTGTVWVDIGEIRGPIGVDGPVGPAGTIDHIVKTVGDGSAGSTDTYTAYADVGETQVLGTFDVYNGADLTNVSVLDDATPSTTTTYSSNEIDNKLGTLYAIPIQTDNAGKYLTTNGTDASWGEVIGSEHYDQETEPIAKGTGATWYVPSTGVLYKYVSDGTTSVWIDISTTGISQTYVDAADALKADQATTYTKIETDAAIGINPIAAAIIFG